MHLLRPILIAFGAATVCSLCAFWAVRSDPARLIFQVLFKRSETKCGCACCCGEGEGEMGSEAMDVEVKEGASMMEQLVPEITTHALSYLDYTSLCRLSMTNSAMRRAANDDGAWKALYNKDFTTEQFNVNPRNGWKAYYAATRAVINVNAEFYNIIRERSLPLMSRFWLNAEYVKCVHSSGELFSGYNAVMDSWSLAFNWGQGAGGGQAVGFQLQDVRARVLSDMAWLTFKAYPDVDAGPFHVTNVYEFHNGHWYMVHHHSSPILMDGAPNQFNFLG
ncbi:Nuclear transport factor 2 (NTF2) family protein [Rhynchospora pubera]|uniref:Nuclear transport factor 2 (NTF2) family protein n=1 Tax=Rhynchospora pubera TaxID=906938 RepID=A0AAV8C342_9POAL|nr:Nuclear transport factor 2 (NTF2) family protein [Rhynchospora pubera]